MLVYLHDSAYEVSIAQSNRVDVSTAIVKSPAGEILLLYAGGIVTFHETILKLLTKYESGFALVS